MPDGLTVWLTVNSSFMGRMHAALRLLPFAYWSQCWRQVGWNLPGRLRAVPCLPRSTIEKLARRKFKGKYTSSNSLGSVYSRSRVALVSLFARRRHYKRHRRYFDRCIADGYKATRYYPPCARFHVCNDRYLFFIGGNGNRSTMTARGNRVRGHTLHRVSDRY